MVGGGLLFGVNLDGPRPRETFVNASLLVDDELNVIDRYRKRHYVPFGEYVPLRGLLGGLPPLRQIPRDGVPADGPQTVTGGAVRTAVVICYETLFPDIVRTNVTTGDAGLLVAVTNDASFGRSWQSSQHIAQSRLRAVETGRWVVHAALSGGSAIIRPDGRIVEGTELFERTTMRKHLPVVTADTAYLDLGGWIDTAVRWSSAGVALIAAATVISRGRASSRRRSSRQRSQLPHEERS